MPVALTCIRLSHSFGACLKTQGPGPATPGPRLFCDLPFCDYALVSLTSPTLNWCKLAIRRMLHPGRWLGRRPRCSNGQCS